MDSPHLAFHSVAQQLRILVWDENKANVKKLVQASFEPGEERCSVYHRNMLRELSLQSGF